eukprot:gene7261-7474_t
MDRGAYNTGAGMRDVMHIFFDKEDWFLPRDHIPGTDNYQARHGADGLHQNVEKAKAYIPGTEENRMRHAGVTDPMHTGTTGGPTMGQQMKQHMPGTNEYEATHGMDNAHRNAEQLKGYIPGTEEHRIKEATHPAGGGFTTHDHSAGMGSGYGHTGAPEDNKPLGQKIKEHIPGTREHEAKKMVEGRF